MSTRDLALAALEQAINGLLKLDPETRKRLAALHGKVIGVHLQGLEWTLYFIPDQTGRLLLQSRIESLPDALLSGHPLDLLRSSVPEQSAEQLFAGRVAFAGDTRLAQTFGRILAGLNIDWEEPLAQVLGDPLAHRIGNAARAAWAYGNDTAQRLQQDLAEYLVEEARFVAHDDEVNAFIDEVDVLRDDVERLEARLKWLERRLEGL